MASAIAMLLMGFVAAFEATSGSGRLFAPLAGYQATQFWTVTSLLIGVMQITALALYPRAELLRVVTSFVSGCSLFWLGVASASRHMGIEDICLVVLGLSNLYGFIVNASLLRKTWES